MGILRPFLLSELALLLNFSISRLRGHGAHHRILRPRSFCLNEKLIRGKGEREVGGNGSLMGNGLRLWRGGLRCISSLPNWINAAHRWRGEGNMLSTIRYLPISSALVPCIRDRPRTTSTIRIYPPPHALHVLLFKSKQIQRPFSLMSEDVICGLTGRQNRRHFMSA